MIVLGHRIAKRIDIFEFRKMLENYRRENVICADHTFFRLSEKQREIFTCEKIKEYLFDSEPFMVGVQNNGCHAVFYKYEKQRFLRIILDIRAHNISVVTFYVIEKNQLPVIK
jgi:hypothetical protein